MCQCIGLFLQELRWYYRQTIGWDSSWRLWLYYCCITEPQEQQLTALLCSFVYWHQGISDIDTRHQDVVCLYTETVCKDSGIPYQGAQVPVEKILHNSGITSEPWHLFRLNINSCFNVFHVLEGEISVGTGVVCRSLSIVWYLVVYCWSWLLSYRAASPLGRQESGRSGVGQS